MTTAREVLSHLLEKDLNETRVIRDSELLPDQDTKNEARRLLSGWLQCEEDAAIINRKIGLRTDWPEGKVKWDSAKIMDDHDIISRSKSPATRRTQGGKSPGRQGTSRLDQSASSGLGGSKGLNDKSLYDAITRNGGSNLPVDFEEDLAVAMGAISRYNEDKKNSNSSSSSMTMDHDHDITGISTAAAVRELRTHESGFGGSGGNTAPPPGVIHRSKFAPKPVKESIVDRASKKEDPVVLRMQLRHQQIQEKREKRKQQSMNESHISGMSGASGTTISGFSDFSAKSTKTAFGSSLVSHAPSMVRRAPSNASTSAHGTPGLTDSDEHDNMLFYAQNGRPTTTNAVDVDRPNTVPVNGNTVRANGEGQNDGSPTNRPHASGMTPKERNTKDVSISSNPSIIDFDTQSNISGTTGNSNIHDNTGICSDLGDIREEDEACPDDVSSSFSFASISKFTCNGNRKGTPNIIRDVKTDHDAVKQARIELKKEKERYQSLLQQRQMERQTQIEMAKKEFVKQQQTKEEIQSLEKELGHVKQESEKVLSENRVLGAKKLVSSLSGITNLFRKRMKSSFVQNLAANNESVNRKIRKVEKGQQFLLLYEVLKIWRKGAELQKGEQAEEDWIRRITWEKMAVERAFKHHRKKKFRSCFSKWVLFSRENSHTRALESLKSKTKKFIQLVESNKREAGEVPRFDDTRLRTPGVQHQLKESPMFGTRDDCPSRIKFAEEEGINNSFDGYDGNSFDEKHSFKNNHSSDTVDTIGNGDSMGQEDSLDNSASSSLSTDRQVIVGSSASSSSSGRYVLHEQNGVGSSNGFEPPNRSTVNPYDTTTSYANNRRKRDLFDNITREVDYSEFQGDSVIAARMRKTPLRTRPKGNGKARQPVPKSPNSVSNIRSANEDDESMLLAKNLNTGNGSPSGRMDTSMVTNDSVVNSANTSCIANASSATARRPALKTSKLVVEMERRAEERKKKHNEIAERRRKEEEDRKRKQQLLEEEIEKNKVLEKKKARLEKLEAAKRKEDEEQQRKENIIRCRRQNEDAKLFWKFWRVKKVFAYFQAKWVLSKENMGTAMIYERETLLSKVLASWALSARKNLLIKQACEVGQERKVARYIFTRACRKVFVVFDKYYRQRLLEGRRNHKKVVCRVILSKWKEHAFETLMQRICTAHRHYLKQVVRKTVFATWKEGVEQCLIEKHKEKLMDKVRVWLDEMKEEK